MADPVVSDKDRATGTTKLRSAMYGTTAGELTPQQTDFTSSMYNTQRAGEDIREYKTTDPADPSEDAPKQADHPILKSIAAQLEKQRKNLELMELLHEFLQKAYKFKQGGAG